jgi:hypothetical protein
LQKLNKGDRKKPFKFNFLKALDDTILKDEAGRIYLIVSDREIKKIGRSECKGGIKGTLSFYEGARQGGPSLRTFGISVLIEEELKELKKVEIYMITSKKITAKVNGLFGEKEMDVSASMDMEHLCKDDYEAKEGVYPPWNFQENGKKWPQYIKKRWDALRSKRKHKRKSLNR